METRQSLSLIWIQLRALIWKDLLVVLVRRKVTTLIRAFFLPCLVVAFLANARYFFIPDSSYGFGEPAAIESLASTLSNSSGGRSKLAFVNPKSNPSLTGRVITAVTASIPADIKISMLTNESDLQTECRSTITGTSDCIAAAVFYSSPEEGQDVPWNYSIRVDSSLGNKIDVHGHDNSAQTIILPFQHAIDRAIVHQSPGLDEGSWWTDEKLAYPYTSITTEERLATIRVKYMSSIEKALAVAFYIGVVPITYQLTGLIARERESGMTDLIDTMMPMRAAIYVTPRLLRLLGHHIALDLVYLPSWAVVGFILSYTVFTETSTAILVSFSILAGLSTASFSLMGASLFRKAQLSSITVLLVLLVLAIIAQFIRQASTGCVAVLSSLFPPMNFVFYIILVASWEGQGLAASMIQKSPASAQTLPGLAFWMFSILQVPTYFLLGIWVQKTLYTSGSSRPIQHDPESRFAVSLTNVSIFFKPSLIPKTWSSLSGQPCTEVKAVRGVDLHVLRGEVFVLLGPNGSGKSTTMAAIAGQVAPTHGHITFNYRPDQDAFGFCPQKNVMWDDLTVVEHVKFFSQLKQPQDLRDVEVFDLIDRCGLGAKTREFSKVLSGGEKRKLQLAMMLTGGSSICCIDEVSSGLDPISRRRIWDILVAERDHRSLILTTHFLDEAEVLADRIGILANGMLKNCGTSTQLKATLPAVHKLRLHRADARMESVHNLACRYDRDFAEFYIHTTETLKQIKHELEQKRVADYELISPSLEDVFFQSVSTDWEFQPTLYPSSRSDSDSDEIIDYIDAKHARVREEEVHVHKRRHFERRPRGTFCSHTFVLLKKRIVLACRNPIVVLAPLLIPIVAVCLVQSLLLKGLPYPTCNSMGSLQTHPSISLSSQSSLSVVVGPPSRLSNTALESMLAASDGRMSINNIIPINTTSVLNDRIRKQFSSITPGGIFLGDSSNRPLLTWKADAGSGREAPYNALMVQNLLDVAMSNQRIVTSYQPFDQPSISDTTTAFKAIIYLCLVMSMYPAFFGLYPAMERIRRIREVHYSNGARPASLWSSHLIFDLMIVLVVSVVTAGILNLQPGLYYGGYLYLIFFLYGFASTLFSYWISLVAPSQLAAFAVAACAQAAIFILYLIGFMGVLTWVDVNHQRSALNSLNFSTSILLPIIKLTYSLILSLNAFHVACSGQHEMTPSAMTAYGTPIVYLIGQILFYSSMITIWEANPSTWRRFYRRRHPEIERGTVVSPPTQEGGLSFWHISKSHRKKLAVDDVTFSVSQGQTFALLGPNGAGKSTCLSLISGVQIPSTQDGDIRIDDLSILDPRTDASRQLGTCPQFDAFDSLTVMEHLILYARLRGIAHVHQAASTLIEFVGLNQYADRIAHTLSGGNKRKLSLAIALTGNPTVLILDEPSSGMDVVSKRSMWQTLESVCRDRAILLVTHSMEEVEALAKTVGILSHGRMVESGPIRELKRRYQGQAVLLRVEYKPGSAHTFNAGKRLGHYTSDVIVHNLASQIPNIEISSIGRPSTCLGQEIARLEIRRDNSPLDTTGAGTGNGPLALDVITALEPRKAALGINYYSIDAVPLDELFMSILEQAGNYKEQ
ncbi:uncharacterized protein Z518_08917 [Rhinocladiella mackenziei CBS 650.93]|uniref:ABC transporter domain-containing protein n=1 Tax=Rhinocladiella mackenziei CBS 650.93 TaxID=1442369 RepID=A0A0D2FGQ4_9EURO|nr:uncharacterized protein Z518_08917 [Rhinocladiella mackenziei CBS 650.93]KIX01192.1 hypothetical protein Z518_08917 [Rhinocladiella mackenziei CBS 650.93]